MSHHSLFQIITTLLIALVVSGCGGASTNSYTSDVSELGGTAKLTLDFSSSDITDEDLKDLDFPDALIEINLAHTAITDEGVAELKRAPNLKSLVLAHTKITEKAIEHLKEMPNLRDVNIACKGIPFEEIITYTKYLNSNRPANEQTDHYQTGIYGPPPDASAAE